MRRGWPAPRRRRERDGLTWCPPQAWDPVLGAVVTFVGGRAAHAGDFAGFSPSNCPARWNGARTWRRPRRRSPGPRSSRCEERSAGPHGQAATRAPSGPVETVVACGCAQQVLLVGLDEVAVEERHGGPSLRGTGGVVRSAARLAVDGVGLTGHFARLVTGIAPGTGRRSRVPGRVRTNRYGRAGAERTGDRTGGDRRADRRRALRERWRAGRPWRGRVGQVDAAGRRRRHRVGH